MKINEIMRSENKVGSVHVNKSSSKSLEAVLTSFEKLLGSPTLKSIEDAITNHVAETAIKAMEGKSHFMILGFLDMGAAVPSLKAGNIKARQYLIGNPLLADKMIKHNIEVALYVPLRVLLAEGKAGTTFDYDLPSSLLGQWHNPDIEKTAKDLDLYLDQLTDAALG